MKMNFFKIISLATLFLNVAIFSAQDQKNKESKDVLYIVSSEKGVKQLISDFTREFVLKKDLKTGDKYNLKSFAFSACGKYIYSVSNGNADPKEKCYFLIKKMELPSGKIMNEIKTNSYGKIACSKDGNFLVSSGKNIHVWNTKDYNEKIIARNSFHSVSALFLPNGNLAVPDATGSLDNLIFENKDVYDKYMKDNYKEKISIYNLPDFECIKTIYLEHGNIDQISCSLCGKYLGVRFQHCSNDKDLIELEILDIHTGNSVQTVTQSAIIGNYYSLDIDNNNIKFNFVDYKDFSLCKRFLVYGEDVHKGMCKLNFVDLQEKQFYKEYNIFNLENLENIEYLRTIKFSPCGKYIALACDKNIKILEDITIY